jgi:hypothetical protein
MFEGHRSPDPRARPPRRSRFALLWVGLPFLVVGAALFGMGLAIPPADREGVLHLAVGFEALGLLGLLGWVLFNRWRSRLGPGNELASELLAPGVPFVLAARVDRARAVGFWVELDVRAAGEGDHRQFEVAFEVLVDGRPVARLHRRQFWRQIWANVSKSVAVHGSLMGNLDGGPEWRERAIDFSYSRRQKRCRALVLFLTLPPAGGTGVADVVVRGAVPPMPWAAEVHARAFLAQRADR